IAQVADAPNGLIQDYDWSPKGNYLAYSMGGRNGMSNVYIWNSEDNKTTRVTPTMFNANSVAFDPSGNYLYFISAREFAPQISNSEFNYATNRMGQIYALALRKDTRNPFPYESDEVSITEDKKPDGAPGSKPTETPEKIDFDGIEGRVTKAPLPADNY